MKTPEIRCQLDHLVICASTLSDGVDWLEQLCSVRLPIGGSHPLMGTHNHLSALSPGSFIEIIACDPEVPPPERPRWFNLDNQPFQAQLRQSPRLATWVVGTRNMKATLDTLRADGIDAGDPVALTRGDLRWQIALRADGTLAYDGVFPILIQWPDDINPVDQMQDQGLRLNTLHLQHPQADRIKSALRAIGADHLAELTAGESGLLAQMSADGLAFELS